MRVAALYDVHGNLPALEAVLSDPRCRAADVIVSGGDLVAGPYPAECLDLLVSLGERVAFLTGNGDREVVSPSDDRRRQEVGAWCAARLAHDQLAQVRAWPLTVELDLPRLGRVLFCHATPRSDLPILTRATPEEDVATELDGTAAAVVVCGHTHVQYDRAVRGTRVVNAGSVGMPYEGSPGARWAILSDESGVEHLSTAYEVERALSTLGETGFPLFDAWFADSVSGAVTADEATDEFERRRRGA